MTRFRFASFLTLACTAIAACSATIVAGTAAAVRFMLETIAAPCRAIDLTAPLCPALSSPGMALPRDLQNGLRHEASVSRRASARNT